MVYSTSCIGDDMKSAVGKIKSKLKIVKTKERTFIVAMAVHKNPDKNFMEKIPLNYGEPIGGFLMNDVNKCYYMNCANYVFLGYVPLAYRLEMPGVEHWNPRIPLPEQVICEYLNETRLEELNSFKESFNGDYTIQFMQLVGENSEKNTTQDCSR